MTPEPIVLSWSGGKDSALALAALASAPEWEVVALLTTVTAGHDRISMHGVRRELLHAQAESLELPLIEAAIPPAASNEIYEAAMGEAFERLREGIQMDPPLPRLCGGEGRGEGAYGLSIGKRFEWSTDLQRRGQGDGSSTSHAPQDSDVVRDAAPLTLTLSPAKPGERGQDPPSADIWRPPTVSTRAVRHVAFGDLFLADVRAYRERLVAKQGLTPVFPIWGRETQALAGEFIDRGFVAHLVCVDPKALDESFAGRRYDQALLADLPSGVDPCGENGEFHTFVSDGPIFTRPIPVEAGELVRRDSFIFRDLLLNDS
ncbi:MAG: hypothetical protein WD066_19400 [Planctomycetaceae bacterium]